LVGGIRIGKAELGRQRLRVTFLCAFLFALLFYFLHILRWARERV